MTDLATLLWTARHSGTVIDAERIAAPASMEAAYAVQARIAELSGEPVLGFKIGSTSAEAQRLLGTDQPGAGPLLARFVHTSPAGIALAPAQMPAVEAEFAYRLGRPLPARPEPYAKADVAAAVAALAPSIEVVGSRFAGGLAGKGRLRITADGGANIAFVAGTWTSERPARDLTRHAAAMRINGRLHGSGTGARVLGDPLEALLWLANHLRATGRGLNAGEIVTTGTCTGVDPVEPGDRAVADFGDLGRVEIAFT